MDAKQMSYQLVVFRAIFLLCCISNLIYNILIIAISGIQDDVFSSIEACKCLNQFIYKMKFRKTHYSCGRSIVNLLF